MGTPGYPILRDTHISVTPDDIFGCVLGEFIFVYLHLCTFLRREIEVSQNSYYFPSYCNWLNDSTIFISLVLIVQRGTDFNLGVHIIRL